MARTAVTNIDHIGETITLRELCRRLHIAECTYHRHRNSLPTPIRVGRALRFPLAAVEAWEKDQLARGRSPGALE